MADPRRPFPPAFASLPPELQNLIKDANWRLDEIGYSGAGVFKIEKGQPPHAFLKVAPAGLEINLKPERDLLVWLSEKLPVPKVLYYNEVEDYQYLLTSEIQGLMACDDYFSGDPSRLVVLLAEGLKQIHSVPFSDCPFDRRLENKLKLARERVSKNLVTEEDLDPEREGCKIPDLLAELEAKRPSSEELVFTHGDYCLPNILVDPARQVIAGFIDWGMGGVADRYQDLALAARSIIYNNIGKEYLPLFFSTYGLPGPDLLKLDYYQLMDEFF